MINRQHLIRKTKKEQVLDALRVIHQEEMLNFDEAKMSMFVHQLAMKFAH